MRVWFSVSRIRSQAYSKSYSPWANSNGCAGTAIIVVGLILALFITVLGGFLSAAGIYALASLNIAKRTREIGIRKALGASIGNILTLLNREFVIVLSVAAVLGSLAGYFLTDRLLTLVSVFHIPVGIIPVTMCALVIFGIGILTTSATIIKAARSNPVDTLRTE